MANFSLSRLHSPAFPPLLFPILPTAFLICFDGSARKIGSFFIIGHIFPPASSRNFPTKNSISIFMYFQNISLNHVHLSWRMVLCADFCLCQHSSSDRLTSCVMLCSLLQWTFLACVCPCRISACFAYFQISSSVSSIFDFHYGFGVGIRFAFFPSVKSLSSLYKHKT